MNKKITEQIELLRQACADQGVSMHDMTASGKDSDLILLALEFATKKAREFSYPIDPNGWWSDSIFDSEDRENEPESWVS